jgi:hypothetical protein
VRFAVSHGLKLKGFVDAPVLAGLIDLDEARVRKELEAMQTEGLATFRDGRLTGWTLTPAGRQAHKEACAAALRAADGKATEIDAAYRRVLTLNQPFLEVCTNWQMTSTTVLNTHDDPSYDRAVIERLAGIHASVGEVLDDLSGHVARFGSYRPRLATALERVQTGEHDWFTGAMIDSYHTVWFELHEDLLTTLGIERSKEGA